MIRRLDSSKAARAGGGETGSAGSIKNLDKVDNAYDAIRDSLDDIARISQNTGMPEWKIKKLKDHVFNKDQLLEDGIRRIGPDVETAEAWKRVASGGFDQDDINRLNNEYIKATGNRLKEDSGAKIKKSPKIKDAKVNKPKGGSADASKSVKKPYSKSRPSYAKGQVEKVWEQAKDPNTGKVYDPTGKEITWDKIKPRNGQWVWDIYRDKSIQMFINNTWMVKSVRKSS